MIVQGVGVRKKYQLPIRVHASGKYFEDQIGQPFFWHGDTSWKLFWEFTEEEAREYLTERAKQGFTVIQTHMLPHRLYMANRNGDAPFLLSADMGKPNPAYFSFVDKIVAMAEEQNITLFIAPAWLSGWEQDWHSVFTIENATSFARFLAERYGECGSILGWLHGGDTDGQSLRAAVCAAASLFKRLAPRQLNTYHAWVKGGWLFYKDEPWYDFSMAYAYAYDDICDQMAQALQLEPRRPTLLGETHYESNVTITSAYLRQSAYTSVLMGGAGHTYGHKDIWCKTYFWSDAMCSVVSHHMRVLKQVFMALPWQDSHLLGSDESIVAWYHGRNKDVFPTAQIGGVKLAYIFNSDYIALPESARDTKAWWIDPVSGLALQAKEPNNLLLRIPGENSGGDHDWLFLLEACVS